MSIQAAITEIEGKMAELKVAIDATAALVEPIQVELDALNQAQIDARQVAINKKAEIDALHDATWVEKKKQYAMLASTRMQLRQALNAIGA